MGPLFWARNFGFWFKKSDFCHTTPIFVDDPFLALDMTVNFPPWKRFFDFPSGVTAVSVKKIRLTRQKVFPPPTVGLPSASNSPSALSAGWIKWQGENWKEKVKIKVSVNLSSHLVRRRENESSMVGGDDKERSGWIRSHQTGPTWTRGHALVAIFRGVVSD